MIKRNPNKNSDWDISLTVGEEKESELVEILGDSTMEVKFDTYPNVKHFIEYKRISIYGEIEPTGISITKSTYYALCKPHYYLIVSTERLKKIMKWAWRSRKPVLGGDGNRTYGLLITEAEILGWKDDNA